MTNSISTAPLKSATSYLEREVTSALVKALSAVLGEGITAEKSEPKALSQDCFCVQQKFEPLEFGFLLFGMERSDAAKLEEPGLKDALNQLGASLAASLSARLHCEIRTTEPAEIPVPALPDNSFAIKLMTGKDSLALTTWISSDLLDALMERDSEPAQNGLVPVTAIAARNLDLLLDVEMPVSISFGRAQLPLKDVFKLTIGSMVELNRAISEPVEVIVNNSVIAQGEVVVVEGNFGVRITHVMSKHDRIRSLT